MANRAGVHVVVAVGDGTVVRREFEIVAVGETVDSRAESLAVATHATLRDAWPTLLVAATNPYVGGSLEDASALATPMPQMKGT